MFMKWVRNNHGKEKAVFRPKRNEDKLMIMISVCGIKFVV